VEFVEGDMGPPRETEHRSGWKDFCAELLSHLVPFEWLPPWYVVVAGIFVTLAALVYFAWKDMEQALRNSGTIS
jgi:hypothetical protein